MFGAKHYVPILRWKQAERLALRYLGENDRCRITPLIEITPKSFDAPKTGNKQGKKPDPARVLEDQAKQLLESWGYARFFLDLGLIEDSVPSIGGKRHALAHIAEAARNDRLSMVPVTGLKRKDEYQSAVSGVLKLDGRGICLRLLAKEVLEPEFPQAVRSVLRKFGLDESNADLLLDYETFDPQNPELKTLLANIPYLGRWRSLIVASGAFPEDLQRCEKGSKPIPRDDWLTWKRQFFDETSTQRKASFSDYTIQYGHYKEPVEHCIPSVSVCVGLFGKAGQRVLVTLQFKSMQYAVDDREIDTGGAVVDTQFFNDHSLAVIFVLEEEFPFQGCANVNIIH
jgi:hypothetical protein